MAVVGLVQKLQAEDLIEDRPQNAVASVRVAAVLRAAVVAVLITTPKTFAEVILIIVQVDVVAVVTIARVLVGVSFFRTEAITVLTVGLSRVETFGVTVIDRAAQHLRAVLARFVVAAAAAVTIVIWTIVVVAPPLQA